MRTARWQPEGGRRRELIDVRFSLDAFQPAVIIWPLLFGLGIFLLLTAQPIGRPKPDLGERLRRLDVDARIRDQVGRRDSAPIFASAILERILRPVFEDVGLLLRRLLGRLGLDRGQDLERKLVIAGNQVSVGEFWRDKVMSGLVGLAFFPLLNALNVELFGPWPAWLWVVGFGVGFSAPEKPMRKRFWRSATRCSSRIEAWSRPSARWRAAAAAWWGRSWSG